MSNLYRNTTEAGEFKEIKYNKLKNRPLISSVVVAVSLKRDPNRKILELEEIEAVACAIQNMYLTCSAWGLGAFWSTPKLIYTEAMNDFLGLGADDKCLALFYIGYPKSDLPEIRQHRKPIEYNTIWVKE